MPDTQVSISFKDVWDAGVQTLEVFGETMDANTQASPAAAVPDADWSAVDWQGQEQQLQITRSFTSHASDWGIASPLVVRFGVRWLPRGHYHDRWFLQNAYFFATLDSAGPGGNVHMTGQWHQPYFQGDVAVLPGRILFDVKQFHNWLDIENLDLRVEVRADGSGIIQP